jgi:phage gp46-like protein
MSDLALYCRHDGSYDLNFDETLGDLVKTESLENVIILSIGTYARARNLGNGANLKPTLGGWWGDALDDKGTLGGYIYEAFPGKLNDATARSLKKLVEESLEWMVNDGVVKSISCSAFIEGKTVVINVLIVNNDGDDEKFDYTLKWGDTDGI